jgi:heat shock protein HslJ
MGGGYKANDNMIAFTDIFQTEMYCEGSKESDFLKLLQNTSGYHFTSFGELILDLKFDSGSVVFK